MANYTYSQGSIDVIYPPNEKKTYTSIIVEPGCDAPPPTPGENKFASLVDGSITEVTAEDLAGVTEIRKNAFSYSSSLRDIAIPPSITKIGDDAFIGTSGLHVYITDIKAWCEITISSSYANPLNYGESGKSLYFNGSLLVDLVIPNDCSKLRYGSFYKCSQIKTIVFQTPSSCTLIGNSALSNCGIKNIVIPEGVSNIGYMAFNECNYLAAITLPSTLTSIDGYAFQSVGANAGLCTYTILATIPPNIQSSTFGSSVKKIIVPAGTGDTYKAATNWSAFADYIEEATE